MIYESGNAGHKLGLPGGGNIEFAPGVKRNEQGDQFGVVDTANVRLHAPTGLDAKTVEHFVESSPAYLTRKVGVSGIWRQADRLGAEHKLGVGVMQSAFLQNMSFGQLRGLIQASGVACPTGDVAKEELVALAAQCLSGTVSAGTVPGTVAESPVTPLSEMETVETPQKPKPKKK